MKQTLLVFFFGLISNLILAQAPVFDDLYFDADSTAKVYQAKNKNFVIVKSKRGSGGVNKTSGADSVRKFVITDIVLVFTETESSDLPKRELANKERWENLLTTYPELFQDNTNLINTCQCKIGGNSDTYKDSQGFYVYFEGKEEKKIEPAKTVVKKEEPSKNETKTSTPTKTKAEPKPEKIKEEKIKEEKTVKAEKPKKEKEAEVEKPKKEKEVEAAPIVKTPVEKRDGYAAPKRSKDLKACRPACYESGNEEIYDFFKEYLPISKKQKKQLKDLVTILRIQLGFDGTVKKIFVQGGDPEFNKLIEETVKNNMNTWYPAVKGGVTIKSEVRLTLKYDNTTKAIRPSEINYLPKPAPKCTCVPDSQLFGE